MTVTNVVRDADARTMTLTAHYGIPVERVWERWADPRRLERGWGPPTYPATMEKHDLTPGGTVTYYMTSPEGERHRGWWLITAVEPPASLEFEDGFADADGNPSANAPTAIIRVALSEPAGGGTQMDITTTWDSDEAMQRMLASGMESGMTEPAGQIDELLALPARA